uniref:DUF1648 domain-containing protein n=1 Tax=mine drainage metagenome TaxID=410659 RepID=E6QL65_9ZZZZ
MAKAVGRVREGIAALGLAAVWAIPAAARLKGLPERIPTHFGLSGQADGWGSANQIFLMPVVALGLYLLLTVVVRNPESFHYGVAVTAENRARLQQKACDLVGWLKVESVWLLAVLMEFQAQSAERGAADSRAIAAAAVVGGGVILGTILWFQVAMARAAKPLG